MRIFGYLVLIVCLPAGTIAIANTKDTKVTKGTKAEVRAQSPGNEAAAAVLAAARDALGGEKKLAAVKTIVATGRTRQVRGENLVPIEFEIAIELPDKYVRKDEIPAQESDPTTVGFNGDELVQFPVPTIPAMPARAGGPPAPTPDQLESARRTRLANVRQDFARLTLGMFAAPFTSFPLTFSYVAKAEAPQGKADVIDIKGPSGFSARFFISADTHLPIMMTWQAPAPPQRGGPPTARAGGPPATAASPPPAEAGQRPAPPGPAVESRIYYGDYRDVNGVQFPFRLRRAVGPDTVEETIFDGFKINARIDPKKFEVRK